MAWLVCVRVPTSLIGRFSSATTRMTCEVSLDLSLELLPRFPFSPLPIEFYEQLLGFTGFYLILLGFLSDVIIFTGFYWVLLGFTGFYWVYWV